jgi:hypothetical protein
MCANAMIKQKYSGFKRFLTKRTVTIYKKSMNTKKQFVVMKSGQEGLVTLITFLFFTGFDPPRSDYGLLWLGKCNSISFY